MQNRVSHRGAELDHPGSSCKWSIRCDASISWCKASWAMTFLFCACFAVETISANPIIIDEPSPYHGFAALFPNFVTGDSSCVHSGLMRSELVDVNLQKDGAKISGQYSFNVFPVPDAEKAVEIITPVGFTRINPDSVLARSRPTLMIDGDRVRVLPTIKSVEEYPFASGAIYVAMISWKVKIKPADKLSFGIDYFQPLLIIPEGEVIPYIPLLSQTIGRGDDFEGFGDYRLELHSGKEKYRIQGAKITVHEKSTVSIDLKRGEIVWLSKFKERFKLD